MSHPNEPWRKLLYVTVCSLAETDCEHQTDFEFCSDFVGHIHSHKNGKPIAILANTFCAFKVQKSYLTFSIYD